jgi:type I restriction enzyme S subunit
MGFDLQETRLISDEGHEFHAKSRLHEGDLVSVRTGDPGTTAVVTEEFDGCNCIDLVIIRRPAEMLPRYLGWFLNSNVAKVQYQLGSEGALQAHFNVETSKETLVVVPSAAEQSEIVDHLEAALNAHDEAVSKITKSVEKLTEYRAALVTAAVTGKIRALLMDPAPAALMEEA